MNFLRNNKLVGQAQLTVRKAGKTPLEYFKIELENVRVTSINAESRQAPSWWSTSTSGFRRSR